MGPRRRHGRGRRLTLAPAVNEVRAASLSPRDPLINELPCVCGDADSNNTLRNDDVVRSQLNIEDAYHDCIMAGFTSEEAMDYIKAKENSLQQRTAPEYDSNLIESFWVEVGFPKGTRWWECENLSEGKGPDYKQCIPKVPSISDKSSRLASRPISKKGFALRPWRGPLPKRKPMPITLEAFLPDSVKRVVEAPKSTVRPSHEELVQRARLYGGKSWRDIFTAWPGVTNSDRIGKEAQRIPSRTPAISVSLDRSKSSAPNPTPPKPISPSTPSYAEVA